MKTSLSLIAFLLCACVTPALADPELNRLRSSYEEAVKRATQPLREAYERELRKLLDTRTRSGKLDDATVIKEELERITGQPVGGRSSTPAKDSEAFFVGKSWQNPTGTVFTFNENGECIREHGGNRTVGVWRRRDSIVEAPGKTAPETRYFRFVSPQEAYVGNSRDDIKMPLTLR